MLDESVFHVSVLWRPDMFRRSVQDWSPMASHFWVTFATKAHVFVTISSVPLCHTCPPPPALFWSEVHWPTLWERWSDALLMFCVQTLKKKIIKKKWRLPMIHFAIIKLFANGTWTCVRRVSVLYLSNPTPAQKKKKKKKSNWWLLSDLTCDLGFPPRIKDFQQNGRQLWGC